MNHITRAIEDVLDEIAREERALVADRQQGEPTAKEERAYLGAQRRAFVKALSYHQEGVRVQWTGRSATLPSASRPGAVVHRLVRDGGVWRCDCEAAQSGRLCWHVALVCSYEKAGELADAHDDGLDAAPDCRAGLSDEYTDADAARALAVADWF